MTPKLRIPTLCAATLLAAACGSAPKAPPVIDRTPVTTTGAVPPAPTSLPPPSKPAPAAPRKGGGYYQDDGPGDDEPPDLDAIPDAVPRHEPLHRFANNPYTVLGKDYTPRRTLGEYRARGIASWYGKKFHGQKTSSGEVYNMYGMTAAHPTLPIPSYVRVTNPANRKSVVVRINDRGPFHAGRLIDLSWTAAAKLGYIGSGSTLVEVESILPGQETMLASAPLIPKAPPLEDPIARIDEATRPPPTPLTATQEVAGHYLQLGAFGNRDNAEALQSRLGRELGALGDKLVIRSSGSLHRVQLGPWTDLAAAREVAEQLRKILDFTPVVIQR